MRYGYLVVMGMVATFVGTAGITKSARACGGGVVTTTTEKEGTVANAQRIVVSIHDRITEVITQIGVPETGADYAALLPVPNEPTLDPQPVPASELDALDEATKPRVFVTKYESEGDGGGGIGCFCAGSDVAKSGGDAPLRGGVEVSHPVEIGPVTAVVLTATDGSAVTAWLAANGFVIPASHQALVDEYTGAGRYFVAIKRNESVATGGATSIGVHFTLPVEHGELPLRFARLGAASKVTFTVFVSADRTAAPAAPFVTRTLNDLDGALIRDESYASAVAEASTRKGSLGFVIEGSFTPLDLAGRVGSHVGALLGAGNRQIARLTTILPNDALTADAHFTTTFTNTVPRERYLTSAFDPSRPSALAACLAFLLRRPRRRSY
jgi:hypothetical protein